MLKTQVMSLLLLTLASLATCQDLKLPATVTGETGDFIVVQAETTDPTVKWYVVDRGLKLFPQQLQKDTKSAVVVSMVNGSFRLLAVSAKGDNPSDFALCTVVVGDAPPGPTPVPPGPTPIPPGPTPVPPPNPAPIKADGFRVLIMFEEGGYLPEKQVQIVTSPLIRQYLNSKCVKESNGQASYRFWDDDYKESNLAAGNTPQYWRDAYKEVLTKKLDDVPWIVVSDGKTGESVPLPANVDDTLTLLKKYGGN